jgi:hypothetical protein
MDNVAQLVTWEGEGILFALFAANLAAASQYLGLVLKDSSHLPDVPQNWLLLYGGSQALYLGRRLYLTQTYKQK